jgi:hypothetical protein
MSATIQKGSVLFESYTEGRTKPDALNIIACVSRQMNFYEHYGMKMSDIEDQNDLLNKIKSVPLRNYLLKVKNEVKRTGTNRYATKYYKTLDSKSLF